MTAINIKSILGRQLALSAFFDEKTHSLFVKIKKYLIKQQKNVDNSTKIWYDIKEVV